jgi:dTDP-4-dehydrorhamnose 3,5-epimerase
VNPLDPDIAIAWPPEITQVMSPRDACAPGLRESLEAGLLPAYSACLAAGQHEAR